jgi:hypothetical protein
LDKAFGTPSPGTAGVYYGVTYTSSGGYGTGFNIKPYPPRNTVARRRTDGFGAPIARAAVRHYGRRSG